MVKSMRTKQFFKDIKIVDFTWIGAGTHIIEYLVHYGAEAIKVESELRPDPIRLLPPFKDNQPGLERGYEHQYLSENKLSIKLNLRNPKGIEVAKKLVARADIVIDNWTAGTMQTFGLNYEELRKIKPDIIQVSSCMQGQTGPAATHGGSGLTLTSLVGFNYLTGWPDRPPAGWYSPYTDQVSPIFAAVALMAALDYRRRTGKGQFLDLSQYECCLHFLAPVILDYTVNGREFMRRGNKSSRAAPHGVYRCHGDDRWCAIAVYTDKEWQGFCQVIGNPGWTTEPRFATLLGRIENGDELDKRVEEWTISRSPEEVMALMQAAGVAAGVVANGEDMWNDPQLKHYESFCEHEHPVLGSVVGRRRAVDLSKMDWEIHRAPLLGEHTEHVCTQILGMSDEEFVGLMAEGIFE
ncbi:MAG: CoA transferase [Chloroflexi bacterium]|nr:CoA transferase [Chloroflexota bacterium]